MKQNRRTFLAGAAASAAFLSTPVVAQNAPRVVVVGGGFGGASFARALRALDRRAAITLVEPNRTFTACPFSNEVIAGMRELGAQQFGYDTVAKDGIALAFSVANAIDPQARSVTLAAEELHVTPSAVSHRIRQLESQLGVALLERGDFALTSEGSGYLAHVRQGLASLAQVPGHEGARGTARLRVAVTPTFSRQLLLPQQHPHFARRPQWAPSPRSHPQPLAAATRPAERHLAEARPQPRLRTSCAAPNPLRAPKRASAGTRRPTSP